VAKDTQGKVVKTTLESQGNSSENWHSDLVPLILYQAKKKKRDEVADD
jgi:hypothetical protein